MPSALVNRRQILLGAAVLAAVGATGSACGSSAPPEPDPLLHPAELARRDSAMATAAATTADAVHAPMFTVIAAERAAHADALDTEIARAAGEAAPSSQTSAAESEPTTSTSRQDVIAALRESAEDATQLAAKQSGYRAGLLGSIAASCTSSIDVPLSMTKPAR